MKIGLQRLYESKGSQRSKSQVSNPAKLLSANEGKNLSI